MSRGHSIPCHCGSEAKWYPTSDHVYQKDYGPIYLCTSCRSYVGVHKQGKPPWTKPLGTPAGANLRRLRAAVHALIDPFWKEGKYKRRDVYVRMAALLGLTEDECHVGMFDEEKCQRVIEAFKQKQGDTR